MSRFLLLAYESPVAFTELSPEEAQSLLQRYIAWTERLRAGGHLLDSNKLKDGAGRAVRREGSEVVVRDGPYAETKEVIGGYWLIETRDYDGAVALARDCPHVDYAHLVIRQIDEL